MKKYILLVLTAITLCVGCSINQPPIESNTEIDNKVALENSKSSILNDIEGETPVINSDGYIELKFKNTFSNNYLESISGEKVTMTGYISTLSPISGEFAYLMNLPYQSCPYCIPGTSEIYNTIAIYAKTNDKIKFTESPVTVTGILETGIFTDAFGYEYSVRIKDVTVKDADVDKLSKNVLIYNSVSQEGIIDDINNVFMSLDRIVFYDYYQEYYGMTLDSIENFDTDIIKTIISKLKAISPTDYNDLIATLENATEISEKANANVSAKKYEENKNLQPDLEQVFKEFSIWMTKYEM